MLTHTECSHCSKVYSVELLTPKKTTRLLLQLVSVDQRSLLFAGTRTGLWHSCCKDTGSPLNNTRQSNRCLLLLKNPKPKTPCSKITLTIILCGKLERLQQALGRCEGHMR